LVGFDVLQQQVNLIRRFLSNAQTPDSAITPTFFLPKKIINIGKSIYKTITPSLKFKAPLQLLLPNQGG
jgi:hypothetical protein